MGRRPRIEFEGGVYHAIQRGNNKEYIFKKDNLKKELIKTVVGASVPGAWVIIIKQKTRQFR